MVGNTAFSPSQFIRRACELHLECSIDAFDPESQEFLNRFLATNNNNDDNNNDNEINEVNGMEESSNGDDNANDASTPRNATAIMPRLFVWIPQQRRQTTNTESSPSSASTSALMLASTESFDGENLGALAFINTSTQPITTHAQIQCITLTPLQRSPDFTDAGAASGSNADSNGNNNNTSTESSVSSFHTLQLYTQHVFAPTLKTLPSHESKILQSLEGKIRELDVTLAQCRRSTLSSIPHITLTTHTLLETTAKELPSSGKIDLDELNLTNQLTDDEFLNEVQSIVNSWIPSIQKVTMLPSSHPPPDSDWEEVTYWHNLSQALNHIRAELSKPSTLLTLSLLKSAKRFVSTLALENNTHLKSAEDYVTDVNSFLKHYPAEALSSSMSWTGISDALEEIFVNCVGRVRSSRYYGLDRLVKLVEASLGTAKARMEFALKDKYKTNGILWMDFNEYEKDVYGPTYDLFVQADIWVSKFREFVLDLGRKRKISNIGQVLNGMKLHLLTLKERLDAVHNFRSSHEKLRLVVSEVLMGEEEDMTNGEVGIASSALKEVEESPMAAMGKVDVLDLTDGGKVAFSTALENYERKIDAIEERLAKLLRDKLTACQDAEDMFAVFARFHPLITRTRVHNAVKEFQIQLISTVGLAIQKLQNKFTHKYEASPASQISRVRGIPPISGKILWAKQIERQVNALMKRMGDVLGPNWGQHLEGRQLRRSGDELLSKLDAKSFFRAWVTEWERDMSAEATTSNARLSSYPIVVVPEGGNNSLIAKVNFNEKYELLFREIRYLKWLGFERDIPKTLTLSSEENLGRYPHAMALKGALRSYTVARELITPELEPLVMPQLRSIRESVAEAFGVSSDGTNRVSSSRRVRWDGKEIAEWVAGLTELVSRFEERVETLLHACESVDTQLNLLSQMEYDREQFLIAVQNIQKTVDELSLAGYSDLRTWVTIVDEKMGLVLSRRLENAILAWTKTFNFMNEENSNNFDEEEKKLDEISNHTPTIHSSKIVVEILLRNQEISTSPSLPVVRSIFLQKFHDYISVVCSLPRPSSGRFEVFESGGGSPKTVGTFDRLVHEISTEKIANAYTCIEFYMEKVSKLVQQWFAYQDLWDTRVSDVANAVGDNMESWRTLLDEASEARNTLDSTSTSSDFGPVLVKYDKVHSQVNLKYDSWQKELQSCYADLLGQKIIDFHEKVCNAKSKLEGVTLDGATATYDLVLNVTFIQEMKDNLEPWSNSVSILLDAERLLKRQRHIFRSDWMEGSRLQGQYEHMEHILSKRSRSMEEQMPLLQTRIIAEDKVAEHRTLELLASWDIEKPLRGNMSPDQAKELLSKYEFNVKKAKIDDENLIKAKDALGLDAKLRNGSITSCLDEMSDLKEVWDAVSNPFESLAKIKQIFWVSATPRKIRKQLEDITTEMRGLPNKIRQFDAFISLNETIKGYLSGQAVLSDLKTDALKDRHWKTILTRLGINIQLPQLTVGMLWERGVTNRKKDIAEILTVAQGEMALEQFLGQVKDRWMKQELELVLYQSRVRLIKGWDNLFTVLDDHLGGLILMKSSPYYRAVREFQEEGKLWEDRLTKLRGAFDSWVEVQRRWVYLEGIFFGSADIKAQLPAEWSRFRNVDGEFISLMRRVSARPYAMEALNIENLQRTLERLESLMIVIQRALGDYLAKQRSDFSRFYFLGDDDLLEIIGNSGEPGKVIPHIGKMFAGISSLQSKSSQLPDGIIALFEAMLSKDGEVVPLNDVIEVASKKAVKEWLKRLEEGMQNTLAKLLLDAVQQDSSSALGSGNDEDRHHFIEWAKQFPAQVMILATLINWSMSVDAALSEEGSSKSSLAKVLSTVEGKLEVMAQTVLLDLPSEARKKFEQLITELVHQRDVTQSLLDESVSSSSDFKWLYHLRFQYNPDAEKMTEKLRISLSNANFFYGFEYLGIGDRLVQTPLTDRAYLTLTQALHFRMGANPFGPAGTGKTETVKALGAQLGRFVVVMNCDESFDFGAMGRIFCGLCQVGAWGCFDEFNRLEERILSAVSQQILTIQRGLVERQKGIELLGQNIRLHENVGIFITMNPGYAGRSNLPDNLKTLFRAVAMVKPDSKLISQVMLYSQGIVSAQQLSDKVVKLFHLCESRMSHQSHYDFSLRALKTLLISAGGSKRKIMESSESSTDHDILSTETSVLVKTACDNVLPKLVTEDVTVFSSILSEVFPGSSVYQMEDATLKEQLECICKKMHYVTGDNWLQKILQLRQVLEMRHGVMLVGPSGVGKSSALKVLVQGLEKIEGTRGEVYIIDPKAVDKFSLYGVLDGTTMEWTDGIFTSILRKIVANQKGEADRRHWIVFDGEVDPVWAENLNSVLDDNKLLTLPSGERLEIPNNVRILLEVDSLEQATAATVSRCGMVWFNDDTLSLDMCLEHLYNSLQNKDISGDGRGIPAAQVSFLESIKSMLLLEDGSSLVYDAVEFAMMQDHIMLPTRERLLASFKALLIQGLQQAIDYDENHPDFPMSGEHLSNYAKRWTLHSLLWSLAGSTSWAVRHKLSDMLLRSSGALLPSDDNKSLADYRIRVEDGEYELWSDSVPRMEIESHKVVSSDVVVTTTDTVRHSDVLYAWLSSRMPLILCGPPGSGKTMTLTAVLQSIQGIVMANLNFSSKTTPEIILKTFSQYCVYSRKGKDIVLEPSDSLGSQTWLVVFCDEINLPENDTYGTQRVITFMRQLVEQGGFWREDNQWVKINRIQFVGACNPPTDAGRVEMSPRFLRHAPLILVDFPARDSLHQIYGTFNGGIMKLFPNLKGETTALTEAMVEFYCEIQSKFTPDMQPQYFFSPRELSRWVRGIYESVAEMESLTREELVRIWAHEALRLFCDRLVEPSEREWCENLVDSVAKTYFAGVDHNDALSRPLFYSTWLSKDTRRVTREELKDFLSARLRVFYEEELDVPLVVFDEVLEHILRIDRVLRQPMGHCLLVGDSGCGKTVLSKFVSWMNGLNIFQIKAHSKYTLENFNDDLRSVMRRVGIDGEKVCFIFDESNALGSGFLEAMNALLASGEVPGLFEGDDYTALVNAFRDTSNRNGIIADSEEELWRRFISVVQRNLHVVFTMNPSGGEWKSRATTSPALFNRCVVDWFGTWSPKAMAEVGKEFTLRLDLGDSESVGGSWGIGDGQAIMNVVSEAFEGNSLGGLRQAVVAALVDMHKITKEMAEQSATSSATTCRTYLSPRDYLALIHNFVSCVNKKREEVEDEQLHVNAGLSKLNQTQENVAELKIALSSKKVELRKKESLANQKLQQMVGDQKEAETRKEEAEKMSIEVKEQEIQISRRKEEAQRDLDAAEPALMDAQAAVKSIRKRDLDEVRNLLRPPGNVQLTLECIGVMLGETNLEWSHVRKIVSKADFIPSILGFAADKLTSRQVQLVQNKYLEGNDDLDYERVTRSSKACGPLYKWAESQVKYSTVFNRIQPLRDEVKKLEKDSESANDRKNKLELEVQQLEDSISQYKSDYATLIRDVESLKLEMETVTKKVDRAESLINSLSKESERWSKSSNGFQNILQNLVGDGLLMASFLTYTGFFDFKMRRTLMKKWCKSLDLLGIEFREHLSMTEVLSKASDRLKWQTQGLPSDSLSIENGVILDHCVRFPLIIDPSGQAIRFIMNKFSDQKIQKTSFLDNSFMKTLAGAIRFGTTLLVENVENIDPVLNPILNKEIQRTGGRSLVRIGTEEVDYSPKFNIILTTKNPAAQLTPDICSRVTLVNFTVTPDSLRSQSLSQILKTEKPEVEEQRINLLKLQGEQQVKLRELEDQMLSKISAVEGSILDDDRVVDGMEKLMTEGAQIEKQIASSADVMKQVQSAISKFEPLASLCKTLFVLFMSMRELSFLYEFSASSFMNILQIALKVKRVEGQSEEERLSTLKNCLYQETAAKVGRSLVLEDKMVFTLFLSKFRGKDHELESEDTTIEMISEFIESEFGPEFPWQGKGLDYLPEVALEVGASSPLMLCSAPGHDVSGRVDAMARHLKKELFSVAMGSAEGYASAERMVSTASKVGTWVILRNVHLCTEWLQQTLVKKLQTLSQAAHPNFRLFITSEINPKLPTALLRLSDIIVAEAPGGVKASLLRFFSSISTERATSPVRNRLYLILGWVHAVIQERLRYIPTGWSEAYGFTEADALHALDVIDSLVDNAMGGKQVIDPENLPWDAIRTTLCKGIFGGRITKDSDQTILDNLVSSLFVPSCFDISFKLVNTEDAPMLPDETSFESCLSWIKTLDSYTPPTWIGLDGSAETIRSKSIAQSVLKKMKTVENALQID